MSRRCEGETCAGMASRRGSSGCRGRLVRPVPALALADAFGDGEVLLRACGTHGHDGVVSKRGGSKHAGGRCSAWRKCKSSPCHQANAERWCQFTKV